MWEILDTAGLMEKQEVQISPWTSFFVSWDVSVSKDSPRIPDLLFIPLLQPHLCSWSAVTYTQWLQFLCLSLWCCNLSLSTLGVSQQNLKLSYVRSWILSTCPGQQCGCHFELLFLLHSLYSINLQLLVSFGNMSTIVTPTYLYWTTGDTMDQVTESSDVAPSPRLLCQVEGSLKAGGTLWQFFLIRKLKRTYQKVSRKDFSFWF